MYLPGFKVPTTTRAVPNSPKIWRTAHWVHLHSKAKRILLEIFSYDTLTKEKISCSRKAVTIEKKTDDLTNHEKLEKCLNSQDTKWVK